jgi:NADPH:quinone reductase-like Zn-dependent oxidoreductase
MFAVYAIGGVFEKPLTQLRIGQMPEPTIKEGWQKVKVTHASLNRHDIFTLQGLSGQEEPIPYPMIMGNDGAGTLPDGTRVAIYPVMNAAGWMGDEMLDPKWNVFSELMPGTFADYVAVPSRNAVPLPKGMAAARRARTFGETVRSCGV